MAFMGLVAASAARASTDEGPHIVAGGQMRVLGVASDNARDFKDSQAGQFRDSGSFYQSRFRLYTVAESVDWRARAVWALEIGDITWGDGGGANSGELGCNATALQVPRPVRPTARAKPVAVKAGTPRSDVRVGPGSGGCLGSDGVNVETKNLYIRFDVPWVSHARLRLGAAPFRFLPGARLRMFSGETFGLCACLDDRALPGDVVFAEFTSEDVFQIQFDWQPRDTGLDVQLTAGKASEGELSAADDVDLYMARVGHSFSWQCDPSSEKLCLEDVYLGLEGLLIDQRDLAGQHLGDTFWIGMSFRGEIPIQKGEGRLYVGVTGVYGRRAIEAAPGASCGGPGRPCSESGFGGVGWVQRRTFDWIVTGAGWYTTGDDERNPRLPPDAPLKQDSHRLPVPVPKKSWVNPPLIGEWVLSTSWLGAPELGQSQFQNLSGTYGIGASVQRRLRLRAGYVQAGMGLGVVAASGAADVVREGANPGGPSGGWGKWVVEADGGLVYRFYDNPNFSFRGLAGYMVPERNDPAWAVGFLTQFDF
jgi:hypothetical protein